MAINFTIQRIDYDVQNEIITSIDWTATLSENDAAVFTRGTMTMSQHIDKVSYHALTESDAINFVKTSGGEDFLRNVEGDLNNKLKEVYSAKNPITLPWDKPSAENKLNKE